MKSSTLNDRCSRSPANALALRLTSSLVLTPSAFRGEHVLERVVVGAALEPDLVADAAVMPGEHIGLDDLEPVSQLGARVHVGIVVLR